MIFLTVGSQEPFDRMVRSVDRWAEERGRADVFAQVGKGGYLPRALRWVASLEPAEFRRAVAEATVVVSHAGIGTILTALELRKPVLVMPRRAALRETRSDHQVATARRLGELGRVVVAQDEEELFRLLDRVESLPPPEGIAPATLPELLGAVRAFLTGARGGE